MNSCIFSVFNLLLKLFELMFLSLCSADFVSGAESAFIPLASLIGFPALCHEFGENNQLVWGKYSPPLTVFPKTKSQIDSLLSSSLIHSDVPLTMLLLK